MGIFQPAMLVYQRVICIFSGVTWRKSSRAKVELFGETNPSKSLIHRARQKLIRPTKCHHPNPLSQKKMRFLGTFYREDGHLDLTKRKLGFPSANARWLFSLWTTGRLWQTLQGMSVKIREDLVASFVNTTPFWVEGRYKFQRFYWF